MKQMYDENHVQAYSLVTKDVRVSVQPSYLPERSDPENDVYVFAYEVSIENLSPETIQLLNRHWIVMSAGHQYADVKGDGVVGEQPILEQGAVFTYASFTVIADPIGTMLGSYTFRSEAGLFFDVAIPEFDLVYFDSSVVH